MKKLFYLETGRVHIKEITNFAFFLGCDPSDHCIPCVAKGCFFGILRKGHICVANLQYIPPNPITIIGPGMLCPQIPTTTTIAPTSPEPATTMEPPTSHQEVTISIGKFSNNYCYFVTLKSPLVLTYNVNLRDPTNHIQITPFGIKIAQLCLSKYEAKSSLKFSEA